jgi:DNA-binding response OmpR family regulator
MPDIRPTILIVDDDPEIIDYLKEHFRGRNCETITTSHPATVVEKLKNFSINLMLLDLKMRKLDGFGVLDKIRQSHLTLPPTLIITGYLPKYQEQLKAYGISFEDVISKPFDMDMLEERINQKLGAQILTAEVGTEYEEKIYAKNRCRIGIVEDEEDILSIFSELFKERHYEVLCFNNGTKALKGLQSEKVDILFVDIKLPGLQGDALIKELNGLPEVPYIIVISADPLPEEMEKQLKGLGYKEFISKPFYPPELIERVKTIAAKKGLLG